METEELGTIQTETIFAPKTPGAYCNITRPLSYAEVIDFITGTPEENCTRWPPSRQRNGDIFIFAYDDERHHFDFVADCMNWRNQGTRVYSIEGCVAKKRYYQRRIGKEAVDFRKGVYEISNVQRVLIHYLGSRDEFIKEPPHGNRKKENDQPHIRVMPSVITDIKENRRCVGDSYIKMVSDSQTVPETFKVALPRNLKQLENSRQQEKKLSTVDRCDPNEVVALLQLNTELNGFMRHLGVLPSLNMILINEQLFQEWAEIASTGNQCVLYFSTGFKFRELHVSVLLFHHSHFNENPVIPLAFFIHHRPNLESYRLFFREIRLMAPFADSSHVIFVTNKETAIHEAWATAVPNSPSFVCWFNIKKHTNNILKKVKITGNNRKNYLKNIDTLLDARDDEEFEGLLQELSSQWTEEFLSNFDRFLKDVIQSSIRGKLQDLGIFTEEIGITLASCEGLMIVQQSISEWLDADINSVTLAFYMLSCYYQNEIYKSSSGIGGSWTLHKHYNVRDGKLDDIQPTFDVAAPAAIIPQVMSRKDAMI